MADEPTPESAPAPEANTPTSVVEKLSPTPAPEVVADWSPSFDSKSLMDNVPEGTDPEKFKNWLDKTADPFVAFKSYSEIEKMKSKGLPNETWTDEDHANLNKARGVPESAEAYEFKEELGLEADDISGLQELAYKGGLTSDQANGLAETVQALKEQGRAHQEAQNLAADEESVRYLEDAWGHHLSEPFRANMDLTKDVLTSAGIDPDSAEGDAIYRMPRVVELLGDLGKMMDPQSLPRVNSGDLSTPSTLSGQLDSMMAEPGFSLENPDHKARYRAVLTKIERFSK